ncbi:MAG: hypothetical protein EXS31_00335 [Pedosphaera sp.]|nr:hypothetical protein [Pedosphaera sp.]
MSTLRSDARGAVLLEVVLALVLFVGTVAIVTSAMNSALDGVERQKLDLHASDLAVSVLSELQMGARSIDTAGPDAFAPPFENWTWQLALTPTETETGDNSGLTRVEVVIRHKEASVVHRLAQVLKLDRPKPAPTPAEANVSF